MRALVRIMAILGGIIFLFQCESNPTYVAGHGRAIFFVAPGGDDSWSGNIGQPNWRKTNGPFATLERARDAARELKKKSRSPVNALIYLRGGDYFRTQTLELTEEDSGLTIRPCKNEIVRLIGGKEIGGFKPVSVMPESSRHPALSVLDPATLDSLYYVNLKEQGVSDFGVLQPRGFGQNDRPAALELFFEDRPMTLAEWPNAAWAKISGASAGVGVGQFAYEGERPDRWRFDKDIWTHGYWTYDWADSYVKVQSVDREKKEIITQAPHGVYGYKQGQRYRVLNLLSELDAPGEWYLDRETGILYFRPPSAIEGKKTLVSLLETPLISIKNASRIRIESDREKPSLFLECARGNGVVIDEGKQNSLTGCVLRNIGNTAVVINGGENHSVGSCEIYNTGDGGITLAGGDRQTLKPGHHQISNNHIHHFSRWSRTYHPAVTMSGVGNHITHNHLHDAPHAGILFGGNDHEIAYNEIHNVCQDTGDVGAIYIGRDWTCRGNIISNNYIHHLTGPYSFGAMGVYLDDCASGTWISGNVFYQASHAVFVGGGRDNLVRNNIFVECDPSVHIDARGLTWAKDSIARGGDWTMFEKLESVRYDQPPYSVRYPELARILDGLPGQPLGNVVKNNISVDSKWLQLENVEPNWVTLDENWVDIDPQFVDRKNENFLLKDDSPLLKQGFQQIPFESIGVCFTRAKV